MVKTVDTLIDGPQGSISSGAKKVYINNLDENNECLITFKNNIGNVNTLLLQPGNALNLEYASSGYPSIEYDGNYNALSSRIQIVALY